jgi:hypothetical protein
MLIHPAMLDGEAVRVPVGHRPEEIHMSTKKRGEGRDNPRDRVDTLKARAQAAAAAVEQSLEDKDESLLRAEASGQAAVRTAERANVSSRADPAKDKYFEIDKRVGGAEIALAEELAEAGQPPRQRHRGSGSTR